MTTKTPQTRRAKPTKAPGLRWEWSSYLSAYRARTNGHTISVWQDYRGVWMVEIQRVTMFQTAICAHCKGRGTALASQLFAETRLLRLVHEEMRRAARIKKALGAT